MMWSHLPLKGMMVTICGGCEANNILVLLTRFMSPSLNTQVALVMGEWALQGNVYKHRVIILSTCINLTSKKSLNVVAFILGLTVVVWNPCLPIQHTYNWMMVHLTMRITTKIRLMRLTLSTLGCLWPCMRMVIVTMLMCPKVHPPPWI